jgi:threonine aldolase
MPEIDQERRVVDLRSDTVTRPSREMRAVIAAAEVGDDVLGDDASVAALEAYAAEVLGKEAALFFPSGIMANLAAVMVQAPRGSEVLLDGGAHIFHYEEGGAAAIGGVQLRPIPSERGLPDPGALAAAVRANSRYLPRSSLLCLENTHNLAGGTVAGVESVAEVVEVARMAGLAVHLDGARLPNAAVATGREMREWSTLVDTVMVSLTKGLGAPIGSILAGPASLMEEAWRVRRRLGGAMHQAGLVAAAGLHALRYNLPSLAADHARAARLASELDAIPGLSVGPPETNIVMVDLDEAVGSGGDLVRRLARLGVLTLEFGPRRIRLITHRDVDDDGVAASIAAFRAVTGTS